MSTLLVKAAGSNEAAALTVGTGDATEPDGAGEDTGTELEAPVAEGLLGGSVGVGAALGSEVALGAGDRGAVAVIGTDVGVAGTVLAGFVAPQPVMTSAANKAVIVRRGPPPGGRVQITGARTDGTVRIVVADSGPGFPEDLLGRAFEPFTRGRSAMADRDGTGLGLAIVRAIAEAHGGSVSAKNVGEGGAQVTLRLRG